LYYIRQMTDVFFQFVFEHVSVLYQSFVSSTKTLVLSSFFLNRQVFVRERLQFVAVASVVDQCEQPFDRTVLFGKLARDLADNARYRERCDLEGSLVRLLVTCVFVAKDGLHRTS